MQQVSLVNISLFCLPFFLLPLSSYRLRQALRLTSLTRHFFAARCLFAPLSRFS
jgi:hypothetical protein